MKHLLHVVVVIFCFSLATNSCAKEPISSVVAKAIRAQTLGDYDEAIRLLMPLSDQVAPDVLYRLGWLMTQGGSGENIARGVAMIERAAAMKYPPAMAGLAAIYGDEPASGKSREMPVDHAKWKALMEEASSLGYWRASKALSDVYLTGQHQLTKDANESCRFAALAEQQDFDVESTHNNVAIFGKYSERGSQIHSLLANLSRCYEVGSGGKVDLTLAFAYSLLSGYDTTKIVSKLSQGEKEAGMVFAGKWLEQHPQQGVPMQLRRDIPYDPHVLAKRLAATSPMVAAVKVSNIEVYTEKEAETIALILMCEISGWNWSASHPQWKSTYAQALQDILKARRQFIQQLTDDEKMRGEITPYFEKELTVGELRILVAVYEGRKGEVLARAIAMMMDIFGKAALRMAEMRAVAPRNADSAFREYAMNWQAQKDSLPRSRGKVLGDATHSMILLADVMRAIPRGPGMSWVGEIGLALSGREQEWIEFCALDGGMNVPDYSIASKEQEVIKKWIGASGKNRAAMEAYQKELQAIRARVDESLKAFFIRDVEEVNRHLREKKAKSGENY
ncbi:MAG: hypothetical protein PHU06_10330 [Gallionella sp.]|nr:hypothetical protein [Gallionella sp.]MDD4960274.1 hypothetical protein [Gallionella sp.]